MNFQEMQNQHSISVDSRLAMLRLSSAAESTAGKLSGDHQQCYSCGGSVEKPPQSSPENPTTTTAAAAVTAEMPPEKNTLYGGATTKAKRYSNCCFSSSLEEPFPKRTATLHGGATTTTPAAAVSVKNNHRELPPLISTTPTAVHTYNNTNGNSLKGFIKIPLQESPVTTPSPSPSPAKPPLPPPLYRTFSDPTSSTSYTRKLPTPPPHRTLARTASWSPNVQDLGGSVNNGESPTAMRLKRMKDGMREMRQWCDLMIQEEENKTVKDDERETETETGGEGLCEEAVWVERMGSCLILHFKCPCGKGYQILLCGNNCYYKLTNF